MTDDANPDLMGHVGQPLTSLTAMWHICESCRIVDFGIERIKYGYPCPRCGIPGKGGHLYFYSHHLFLIDLIRELYFERSPAGQDAEGEERFLEGKYRFAVIIFFCTLWETLLQRFLEECMNQKALSREIRDRLFLDHQAERRRRDVLFPLLTGAKWGVAIKRLSAESGADYAPLVEFYARVAKTRNVLLHLGHRYSVPKDMPRQCILQVRSCLQLFVDLHNAFVVRALSEKDTGR